MKWLRALLTLGFLLAALSAATLPTATLAGETSSPCPQGSTWIDIDDSRRHPAALDREALGIYDENGDAQTCLRLVADARAGNLRIAYKASDPDEPQAASAFASCPDDADPVDINKPDAMPAPLTHEILASYDWNGDGRLCVSQSLLGEGDFTIDVHVVDNPIFGYWCEGRLATIIGTPQNDWIRGTAGDDIIAGLDGHDTIYGEEGSDIICGGKGDDEIDGGKGDDVLDGGVDDDELDEEDDENGLWGSGDDVLWGGDGDDEVDGSSGDDYLNGGEGDDFVEGGGNDDELWGGAGVDEMWGDEDEPSSPDEGADKLYGGADDDELHGGRRNDSLNGGADDDELFGDGGDDELFAGGGIDRLDGGAHTDECWGALATTTFISCELPNRHR